MGSWVTVKYHPEENTVTRGITRDDGFTVTHKPMCYRFYNPEEYV
jgi:hypothetical protein